MLKNPYQEGLSNPFDYKSFSRKFVLILLLKNPSHKGLSDPFNPSQEGLSIRIGLNPSKELNPSQEGLSFRIKSFSWRVVYKD